MPPHQVFVIGRRIHSNDHHSDPEEVDKRQRSNVTTSVVAASSPNSNNDNDFDDVYSYASSLLSFGRHPDEWSMGGNSDSRSSSSSSYDCDKEEDSLSDCTIVGRFQELEDHLSQRQHRLEQIAASLVSDSIAPSSTISRYFRNLVDWFPKTILRSVQAREYQVARQKRQALLEEVQLVLFMIEQEEKNMDDNDDDDDDDFYLYDKYLENHHREAVQQICQQLTDRTTEQPDASESQTYWQSIFSLILFEIYVTIPSSFHLILHSLVYYAFFEIVDGCIQYIYRFFVTSYSETPTVVFQFIFYGGILLLGIGSMRVSGYLYWWLNDIDYDCLKFDYRNRRKLGYIGARLMGMLRRNDMARMVVFMLSYSLCYVVVLKIFETLEHRFFAQAPETILADLPSRIWDTSTETVPDFMLCQYTCQEVMDQRDQRTSELLEADEIYTSNVLSTESYYSYWLARVHNEPIPVLSSPHANFLHCLCTIVVTIGVLRMYGFVFWEQY